MGATLIQPCRVCEEGLLVVKHFKRGGGSNDVLVIKANLKDAFGMKERLVPFLSGQVIKKVDLATRSIAVEWDPGF